MLTRRRPLAPEGCVGVDLRDSQLERRADLVRIVRFAGLDPAPLHRERLVLGDDRQRDHLLVPVAGELPRALQGALGEVRAVEWNQ